MLVERFVAWAETACAEEKIISLREIVAAYAALDAEDAHRAECERMLGVFLTDRDANIRLALAEHIAPVPHAPKALIWNLLQDLPTIAAAVYANSHSLCERRLIAGIDEGGALVQQAIATRSGLSANLVRALVSKADAQAAAALLENDEIVLGPVLKHDIATRLGTDAAVRDLLLTQDDLAPATRQMLVRGLSDALLHMVDVNNWADSTRMQIAANDATNRVTIDIAPDSEIQDMAAYIDHLRETSQLTPSLILRSICAGRTEFFEAALASLSGLSLKRVQSIIDDGRFSAFKSLYQRTGLPIKALSTFSAAISTWQNMAIDEQYAQANDRDVYEAAIARITDLAENDPSTDSSLLALLQRMVADVTRERISIEHDIKLLTAA